MRLKTIVLTMCLLFMAGAVHAQTQTGYRIPTRLDIGGGRMTGDMWMQAGTNGVRLYIGTQSVTQVGTTGVINGTIAASLPYVHFPNTGGSVSVNFSGFNQVYIAGSAIPSTGSLTGKINAVGGSGTTNVFTDTTLAGVGTITGTYRINGLDISPPELSMVDGATVPLNTVTGSVTNHTHTGSDGTTQISYNNLTGTGSTDNIAEGSTNKYYQDSRVNAAVGSLSVNVLSDMNIIFNENDFLKISGGQVVSGSSSVTVAFSEVTGSASASQLPLISGLNGSASTSQMPANPNFTGTVTATNFSGNGAGLTDIQIPGTFGTTTQWNSSAVTIYGGSSPSPLSVVTNMIGTNTTVVMSGTSTPSPYQIFASTTYSPSYLAYKAFDGVISGGTANGWNAASNSNEYIEYSLGTGTRKALRQYRITANITDIGGGGDQPTAFDFRGSNDRITYISIDARSGQSFGALETKTYSIATSTTAYQFYRLHVKTGGGTGIAIGELQLIGSGVDSDSIHVTGSGTVGIGTTTPASDLHLIGTFTVSSGIIVNGSTMTVPDYALRRGYSLMPLEALEYYIDTTNHLPNFQSVAETKSFNLVQDNMSLRKTAEETILYLIAMEKKSKIMQLEIEELKLLLNK